ncbi:SGNH/GDSL hydrolase family protein [Acinetobacter gerneri]|uniref:SGNH hydrolase-type esterase domain-containing protein n=1 Tax=Acinetobacter gerneri DSM 14967 = CIP 107464 = MTCC 9824 TaxID=1120926 RepID=N8ZED9_9GAMM|nr:SGNH/GDSL hydrolase family protein [Acinetobacter gerneri]ENV32104.1 hypothetical protein F960_03489 [Acinetobacter gerneri DSM 14967 = CIP 107464 = MTCC 9824]
MTKNIRYVALGGCNTIGEVNNMGCAYPEQIAESMGWSLENYGYTMCSTREGMQFFDLKNCKDADVLSIQYGGVDSWLTFKGSPFVLYYPDSPFRKFFRKIVKKIKKIARKFKWHKLVGSINVVPKDEYRKNLQYMLSKSQAKIILLIDTYPNRDMTREKRIMEYNEILEELSDNKRIFHVKNYEILKKDMKKNYDDSTHLSKQGQNIIAGECLDKIKSMTSI